MTTPPQILVPLAVADANITASNVALETAWTAGTYTLGDQRRVDERLFEVSAASTTEEPSDTALLPHIKSNRSISTLFARILVITKTTQPINWSILKNRSRITAFIATSLSPQTT